jgi:hypothetical protein
MDGHNADTSAANAVQAASMPALERYAEALRRGYQRRLRRKPTTLEREVIDRAATLTARARFAAVDPACTHNQLVRIANLAARARSEAEQLAATTAPDSYDGELAQLVR